MTTPTEDEARALIERLRLVERDGYLSATYLGNEHVGELMGEAADTIGSLLASRVSTPPSEPGWNEGEKHAECFYGEHACAATPPTDEDGWTDRDELEDAVSVMIVSHEGYPDEHAIIRCGCGGSARQAYAEHLVRAISDEVESRGFRRQAVTTPEPVRHISDKRASGMEPTDEDEREALATILATWRDDSPEEWAIDMYRGAADAILAAGFHRQVVSTPEPEWEFAIHSPEGEHLWPLDADDQPVGTTFPDCEGRLRGFDPDYSFFDYGDHIVRRRKAVPAGPWEPVPTTEEEA